MVKLKVKGQGYRFCLVIDQGHYFSQWSMANYISTIDYKVQFIQGYSIIQPKLAIRSLQFSVEILRQLRVRFWCL